MNTIVRNSQFGLVPVMYVIPFFLLLSTCSAQSGQKTLLALSKGDHTMAIVSPVTLKVIARVPVGPDPHEVVASDDGKTAYVANTGGGRSFEINVIDLVAQKPLPNLDTRPLFGPHGLMFAAGKLWFSAEGSKSVGRFDPASNKMDWSMGTGQDRTHMVYATADGKQVYTTNVNEGSVSILTETGNWTHTAVPVSKGSEGFDVTPDGRQLWTVSANDGTIAVIDLATKKVTATLDAKALGANRIKFTPDGKRALVSSLRSGDLLVYDVVAQKEIKRINIGHGGAGILIDDDGSRAFIGCSPDNYVAVVDLKTWTLTGKIDVGPNPDGLAWAVRK